MRLHSDDRGFKGVELGMGLLLMGLLAALALPAMSKISDRVAEVAAAADSRADLIDETLNGDQEVQVAGVQVERSADGATCRWTQAEAGTVYGVWQRGADSLYGVFDARPELCPVAAEAEAAGFGSSFVRP